MESLQKSAADNSYKATHIDIDTCFMNAGAPFLYSQMFQWADEKIKKYGLFSYLFFIFSCNNEAKKS